MPPLPQMDCFLPLWAVGCPPEAADRMPFSILEERTGIFTRDRRKRNPPRPWSRLSTAASAASAARPKRWGNGVGSHSLGESGLSGYDSVMPRRPRIATGGYQAATRLLRDAQSLALGTDWLEYVTQAETEAELRALRRSALGWHSLRRNGLAAGHGEASGMGIHVTSPWPPKTPPSRPLNGRTTWRIDTN